MKKILPFALLLLASCSASPQAEAPPYEVDHFDIDADGQKASYAVSTPSVYSRDSVIKVAQAIQHAALPGAECTIRIYRRGVPGNVPYSTVFYSETCTTCDFNAQDMYGSRLRIDGAPASTAAVPPTGGAAGRDTGRMKPELERSSVE